MTQDRDLAMLSGPGIELVESVRVADPRTLTVGWREPYIAADALFTPLVALPLPKHLLEPAYLDNKAAFAELPYWTSEFVGAGPYRMREFVRSSYFTLQANEGYVLGKPKIDAIEVRFIPDLNVLATHLLSGDVQLAIGRAFAPEHAAEVVERWADGAMAVRPGLSWTGLFPQHVNPSPAALGDVQFRRAILHATDRQQMVDALLHGLVPIAHSLVSPAQAEYDAVQEYVVRYDYDPRASVQIIESFGYVPGADGMFRDPAGERLIVEARSTGGEDAREKMIFVMAEDWSASA